MRSGDWRMNNFKVLSFFSSIHEECGRDRAKTAFSVNDFCQWKAGDISNRQIWKVLLICTTLVHLNTAVRVDWGPNSDRRLPRRQSISQLNMLQQVVNLLSSCCYISYLFLAGFFTGGIKYNLQDLLCVVCKGPNLLRHSNSSEMHLFKT